ncbi:trimethylamine methyltransferase family protein [Fontisubflavum oceani]|uniref:trimethylamine methyltransferase family protein n=1 Tax=Fontisubflavum oceani TaxID=2978973 RepID=UPI0025B57954|nr:trimethylamine methyltransferase family protein [Fontisubflavum oceani]WJY22091.1 trimethylamine methyltransferase family protein [Fontisubflavum oceani]
MPPIAPIGPEEVVRINATWMHVLGNVGAQFRNDIALEDWRKAGAKARCSKPGFLGCRGVWPRY